MAVDKKNRIKKAVLTWLCVAALVSGAVPDSFSGYVPTLTMTAAAEDPRTYVSEIDLQQIVNYNDGTIATPTGVRISSGYEGYTLYIGQNGTYKLKGSNCINNSYVDVTIQCDNGIDATIFCDDVYIKNDNGYCGGFASSGGSAPDSGGEHFSYYTPFYAALGTMTISGNVAVETYFCQTDNYYAPITSGNVTGSFFTVTYKDANGNTLGSTHYLSGGTYKDKSGFTDGKCTYTMDGEGNKTAFSPTTITAAATVICADHDLDASGKCTNCGVQFRKVTVDDGINTPSTHRVADNGTFDRPADPTAPLGKKFAGWYVGDTEYDFSTPITSDITVTAHYEDSLIKSVAQTSNVKDEYIEGNTFDPTGLVITVTYEDNRHEDITYDAGNTKFSFSPLLTTELATTDNKVTVSYGTAMDGGSNCVDIPITVAAKRVTDIAIKTAPTKTAYIEGNKFDPTGLVITASYDNGKSEDIEYSDNSGITLAPTAELTTADNKVTFTYGGKTAEQAITVAAKQLTGIVIKTAPTKTKYIEGEKFNPAGLVITASYNNGKSEDIAYSETSGITFTPTGELSTADTKVTITYGGKTAEQTITVANKQVTDIAIKTAPTKTAYIEGEKFNPAGLVITASYNNGSSEDIEYSATSGITFAPTAELTTADNKVTFTYGGKTAEQTITVANKQVTDIAIKTAPTKTAYIEGEKFNPAGLVITASYNNGSSEDIEYSATSGITFAPTAELTTADTTVTFTYCGKTAEQKITVANKQVTDIAIKTAPKKTKYMEGEKFDPTGLVITASYNNGKSEDIAYSENSGITFAPTAELTTANNKVTFTYGGKTAEQAITVAAKQLTGIVIKTAPTKTKYIESEKFDPTGLVITASYNNGSSEDIEYSATSGITFAPTAELTTADNKVTFTYGGKTAEQAITVSKKSSGGSSGGSSRPSSPTTPTRTNPVIGGSSKSWSDVAADLGKLTSDSEATIELNGSTTVPVDVIKSIADTGSNVKLVINSAYSWIVDGADITVPAAADLTFIKTASTKSDTLRGIEGTQFNINGTNIPTDLMIAFKKEHEGKFANLYKVVDGKLVFVTCAKLGEDGKVILPDVVDKGEYVVMLCEFSDRLGDMDNDGIMNAKDAAAILKDIVEIEPGKNPLMADFNGDGRINAMDAAAILKRIVGLA